MKRVTHMTPSALHHGMNITEGHVNQWIMHLCIVILKKDEVDIASSIIPLAYVMIKWDYVAKARGNMRGRRK